MSVQRGGAAHLRGAVLDSPPQLGPAAARGHPPPRRSHPCTKPTARVSNTPAPPARMGARYARARGAPSRRLTLTVGCVQPYARARARKKPRSPTFGVHLRARAAGAEEAHLHPPAPARRHREGTRGTQQQAPGPLSVGSSRSPRSRLLERKARGKSEDSRPQGQFRSGLCCLDRLEASVLLLLLLLAAAAAAAAAGLALGPRWRRRSSRRSMASSSKR